MVLRARFVAMLAGAIAVALVLAAASASRAAQREEGDGPTLLAPPGASAGAVTGPVALAPASPASPLLVADSGIDDAERGTPDEEDRGRGSGDAKNLPRALVAKVVHARGVVVRRRPNGRVAGRLGRRTEFGSPRVLAVVARRGKWLGVATTVRSNGRLGWIRRSRRVRLAETRISLVADLSRRTVVVKRGDRVIKRARVAVGRPGSSTPTGVFAITDKLNGRKLSSYYGCCILALSGTQPNLPAGWRGGNRLAIHGTSSPGTIGKAASAGCLRGSDRDMRALMRLVPLGAAITIRP